MLAVLGSVLITISDAPAPGSGDGWRIGPYVGLLTVSVGLGFLGSTSPDLAQALALLVLAALVLHRGPRAASKLGLAATRPPMGAPRGGGRPV